MTYCGERPGLVGELEMGDRRQGRIENDPYITGLNNLVDGYEENSVEGKQRFSILDMSVWDVRSQVQTSVTLVRRESGVQSKDVAWGYKLATHQHETNKAQELGRLARGHKAQSRSWAPVFCNLQRSGREASRGGRETEDRKRGGGTARG